MSNKFKYVPRIGFEPTHLSVHAPKACVSTSSTTAVCDFINISQKNYMPLSNLNN